MAVEKVEHVKKRDGLVSYFHVKKTDSYSLFRNKIVARMSPDGGFTDCPSSNNREAFDHPKMKRRKSLEYPELARPLVRHTLHVSKITSVPIIDRDYQKLVYIKLENPGDYSRAKTLERGAKRLMIYEVFNPVSVIVEYPELARPLVRHTLHVSKITSVPIIDRDYRKLVYINLENPDDYSRAKTLERGAKRLMISEVFNPASRVLPEPVLIPPPPVPPILPEPVHISAPPVAPPVPPILVSVPVLSPHSRKETFMKICQCMSHVGFFLLGVSSVYTAVLLRSCVKKWTDSGCPALATSTSSIKVPVHLPSLPNFKLPKVFDLFEVWKKWVFKA